MYIYSAVYSIRYTIEEGYYQMTSTLMNIDKVAFCLQEH